MRVNDNVAAQSAVAPTAAEGGAQAYHADVPPSTSESSLAGIMRRRPLSGGESVRRLARTAQQDAECVGVLGALDLLFAQPQVDVPFVADGDGFDQGAEKGAETTGEIGVETEVEAGNACGGERVTETVSDQPERDDLVPIGGVVLAYIAQAPYAVDRGSLPGRAPHRESISGEQSVPPEAARRADGPFATWSVPGSATASRPSDRTHRASTAPSELPEVTRSRAGAFATSAASVGQEALSASVARGVSSAQSHRQEGKPVKNLGNGDEGVVTGTTATTGTTAKAATTVPATSFVAPATSVATAAFAIAASAVPTATSGRGDLHQDPEMTDAVDLKQPFAATVVSRDDKHHDDQISFAPDLDGSHIVRHASMSAMSEQRAGSGASAAQGEADRADVRQAATVAIVASVSAATAHANAVAPGPTPGALSPDVTQLTYHFKTWGPNDKVEVTMPRDASGQTVMAMKASSPRVSEALTNALPFNERGLVQSGVFQGRSGEGADHGHGKNRSPQTIFGEDETEEVP